MPGPLTITCGIWGVVEKALIRSPGFKSQPCPATRQPGNLVTGPGSATPDVILASDQDLPDKWETRSALAPQADGPVQTRLTRTPPYLPQVPVMGVEEGQEATRPTRDLAE